MDGKGRSGCDFRAEKTLPNAIGPRVTPATHTPRPPPKGRPLLLLYRFLDGQPVVRRLHHAEELWVVEMVEDVPELLPNVHQQVL